MCNEWSNCVSHNKPPQQCPQTIRVRFATVQLHCCVRRCNDAVARTWLSPRNVCVSVCVCVGCRVRFVGGGVAGCAVRYNDERLEHSHSTTGHNQKPLHEMKPRLIQCLYYVFILFSVMYFVISSNPMLLCGGPATMQIDDRCLWLRPRCIRNAIWLSSHAEIGVSVNNQRQIHERATRPISRGTWQRNLAKSANTVNEYISIFITYQPWPNRHSSPILPYDSQPLCSYRRPQRLPLVTPSYNITSDDYVSLSVSPSTNDPNLVNPTTFCKSWLTAQSTPSLATSTLILSIHLNFR